MVKKGYKQTEIGVLPEDWKISTLEVQYNITSSKRVFQSEWRDSGIPFYRAREIAVMGEGVPAPKGLYISEEMYERYSKQYGAIKENDVLITGVGTLGKVYVVKKDDRFYFKDGNIIWLQWNGQYSSQFLKQLYRTPALIDQVFGNSGGSTVPTYTITNAKATIVPCPDYSEQCEIAEVLSSVDTLIAVIEKQLSKKKAIKQGAMQELLTGKRRLPGFSGEWEEKPISFFGNFISGNCFPIEYQGCPRGELPFYKVSDFNNAGNSRVMGRANNYISHNIASVLSCKIIPKNSVVFAKIGAAISLERKRITGFDCCIDNNMMSFLPYQKNIAAYMCYLFQTIRFGEFVEATALPSLSGKTIGEIQRIFPPTVEEQIAIATVLSDLDFEIEALEQKLTKYRQVKQGMMQQLLTGKIRLKNDIVDSVHTEQKATAKKTPVRSAHNHQFDDAVAIAAIVDAFYSDKYPLGRVKVQKLLYLLHRHQAVSVSDFKKKAAGPYADTVRYKGGEPIAKKNKYIVSENGKQGTRYSRGENMAQALSYVERWGMKSDLQWLKENFLHTGRNDLELFATVDMAMSDLAKVGISASVESIKNLIASSKEWKAKLSKTYFSDRDIARAIKKCTELFN